MSKCVAVALSGGIDSAVAALLLKEQGYKVVGITGKMINSEYYDDVVKNAKVVADKLGIEHYVCDVTNAFDKKVIQYFKASYAKGETPNPCIICNKYIKWGEIFEYAINKLGVDYIATGHYADIVNDNGFYKLFPALDENKDQLYFLFELTQKQLEKTLFPLSKYTKSDIRRIAENNNLPPKSAKESQDICFIKAPSTTKKYLNNIFNPREGVFIENSTGKVLGKHSGSWQYTIGQRKGIGIASTEALYVVGMDAHTNTVYLGYKSELYTNQLILKELHFCYPFEATEFEANVKIRYNMNAVKTKVFKNDSVWNLKFNEPVSSIAKGQACVLYACNDGHLIGGGWI